jgi:hypothetical protein
MRNVEVRNVLGRGTGTAFLLTGLTATLCFGGARGTLAHAADGHPAKIHQGSCQSVGPVAYSLTGVGASVDLNENPIPTPQPVNAGSAYQVMTSETTIDAALDDALATDHAVMLYDNDENMQAIACGNLGGALLGDTLVVGLGEFGIPGHVGFAVFQRDGDQTDVTILMGHALAPVSASGGTAGTGDEADHRHESEEESHVDLATPES